LVMELVHGPTLERLLDRRELSMPVAFAVLDGLAAGLEAMHAVGIAHLDIKPANIILRAPDGSGPQLTVESPSATTPVLVDFGLAGRTVRPGCASPYYGAPEIWDAELFGQSTNPRAADVYAFCCLAFEMLTGRTLFQAESLPALIACHLHHGGNPTSLASLRATRRLTGFAEMIAAGLSPSPRHRVSIEEIRQGLRSLAPTLQNHRWPLAA
jgi:eukaryotic-like serine/threonine-protein kinase